MDASKQKSLGPAFLAQHASPHADDPIIVLPNAWDVASALRLARAGFKAIAITSGGVGYTGGYPVGEVMPLDEMLGNVKRMADRIATEMDVALSADMESGYGIAPD